MNSRAAVAIHSIVVNEQRRVLSESAAIEVSKRSIAQHRVDEEKHKEPDATTLAQELLFSW